MGDQLGARRVVEEGGGGMDVRDRDGALVERVRVRTGKLQHESHTNISSKISLGRTLA